jgi:hypothetical protein
MTAVFGGVLIAAFGAINCFFGYNYQRLVLSIWGVLFGAGLALTLTAQAAPLVTLVAAVVGAIIGPLLIFFAFRVGLFLVGAGGGFVLAAALMTSLGYNQSLLPVGLIGGVIFGFLALFLRRPVIIILTALLGASAIVLGASMVLNGERAIAAFNAGQYTAIFGTSGPLISLLWILLALAGAVLQLRSARRL